MFESDISNRLEMLEKKSDKHFDTLADALSDLTKTVNQLAIDNKRMDVLSLEIDNNSSRIDMMTTDLYNITNKVGDIDKNTNGKISAIENNMGVIVKNQEDTTWLKRTLFVILAGVVISLVSYIWISKDESKSLTDAIKSQTEVMTKLIEKVESNEQ